MLRKLITALLLFSGTVFAASPTVQSVTEYSLDSNASTHNVSYPATVNAGDLLVAVFCSDGNPDIGWPGSWVEIVEAGQSGTTGYAIAYLDAAGTESGTFAVTLTSSERAAAAVYRITGAEDPATQAPEVQATTYTTASSSYDPPNITPTGGSKDYLFIAAATKEAAATVSAFPTSYTNTGETAGQTNAAGCQVGYSERQLTASSENPSAMTLTAGEIGAAHTIAVHPSTGGGGGVSDVVTMQNLSQTVGPHQSQRLGGLLER